MAADASGVTLPFFPIFRERGHARLDPPRRQVPASLERDPPRSRSHLPLAWIVGGQSRCLFLSRRAPQPQSARTRQKGRAEFVSAGPGLSSNRCLDGAASSDPCQPNPSGEQSLLSPAKGSSKKTASGVYWSLAIPGLIGVVPWLVLRNCNVNVWPDVKPSDPCKLRSRARRTCRILNLDERSLLAVKDTNSIRSEYLKIKQFILRGNLA